MIRDVRASVWALRAVAALGPLVALLAAVPEGFVPSPFVIVVVAMAGAVYAVVPEHFAGTVVLALVLLWWALVVGTAEPAGGLVAAAALTLAHVAGLILGYGPPQMAVDPGVLRLWALRGAMAFLAAPVIWLVARAYGDHATPTSLWLAGLAAGLVGAVVAAVVVPTRGEEPGG